MSQLMRYIWWSLFNLHVVCKDRVSQKSQFWCHFYVQCTQTGYFSFLRAPDQHREPRINCRKTSRNGQLQWGVKKKGWFQQMLFFWEPAKNVNKDFFVATKVKCNRMLFGFQQNFQLSTTSWWRNLLKNMYRWSAGTRLIDTWSFTNIAPWILLQ